MTCRTARENLPPLPRVEVLRILRSYLRRRLRRYRVEPMREPAAPDVFEDFTVSATWGCREDVLMEASIFLGRFIENVREEFRDRIAHFRVRAAYVPSDEWLDRNGELWGDYHVTVTASLTAFSTP
jgi:hypothetical protein